MGNTKIKTYSELRGIESFDDKLRYLKLNGVIGEDTFGFDRWINQKFYQSTEWKQLRNHIIVRDNGCDLGVEGRDISGVIYIHHMNPIELNDIEDATDFLFNPNYLISVSRETHNYIHYGIGKKYPDIVLERSPNDQCPWRR